MGPLFKCQPAARNLIAPGHAETLGQLLIARVIEGQKCPGVFERGELLVGDLMKFRNGADHHFATFLFSENDIAALKDNVQKGPGAFPLRFCLSRDSYGQISEFTQEPGGRHVLEGDFSQHAKDLGRGGLYGYGTDSPEFIIRQKTVEQSFPAGLLIHAPILPHPIVGDDKSQVDRMST